MKRIIALLVALLALALPALAEPMSTFDYTDDILEDGSLIYYFPEISLRLPADWRGKVMAIKGDDGTSFYQVGSYEKYQEEGLEGGGFLFSLGASVNGSFSELPAFRYLGFCESSAMNYYLVLPSDYPAYMGDEAVRAEYDAMLAEIDYVAENFTIYDADSASGDAEPDAVETSAVEEDAAVTAWTAAQVRYYFEHNAMPRYFYEDPANMLDTIGEVGVYRLWASISTENGVDPTYPAEQYVERWYDAGDITLLQVDMPDPDANTLCYRIYLIYDAATGDAVYYTVESDEFAPEIAFICTWDAERTHSIVDGAPVLDRNDADYEAKLQEEARYVAGLAGISEALSAGGAVERDDGPVEQGSPDLALIACPELGFSTKADPAYAWDYQEGTGISIYTGSEGSIPYVIVFQSGDLLAEPFEFIKEQLTPSVEERYGEDLVGYVEYEYYDIGGKQLPAGLYTYRLQGYLIDMLRLFDSTGEQTVAYTAKYVNGQGDVTLAALDTAIRNYRAE